MSVRITFVNGPRAGETLSFDDAVERVVLGRDPARCQVVFSPHAVRVGREHFALKFVLGRYRLEMNPRDPVFLDGRPARNDQELPPVTTAQVGENGPTITIETFINADLPLTMLPQHKPSGGDTMVRGLRSGMRWTRVIAAAATAVILVLLGILWLALRGTERRIGELSAKQAGMITDESQRLQAIEKKMEDQRPRLQDALRRATPSVLLVVEKDDSGHEQGMATAWVVGKHVLATNAHVAEPFKKLPAGHTMLARTNGTASKDFMIRRVSIHPGFEEFQKLLEDYKPARDMIGPSPEQIQLIGACDVALMYVADSDELPPPIELAPRETIDALQAGDVIGTMGYPMEMMVAGGVNVKHPTATTQVGHVTAVTDFFLMRNPRGGEGLVQHSLPVMGGASGSPILNDRGQVVALVSAGNLIATPGGGRISTGSGVNFGQRVDLLQELLEGNVAEAQRKRTALWRKDIKQFASIRAQASDILARQWIERQPGFKARRLQETKGTVDTAERASLFVSKETVTIGDRGSYLIVAVSASDKPLNLYVFDSNGSKVAQDMTGTWFAWAEFPASGKMSVEAVIAAGEKNVGYTMHVYRAVADR